MSEAAAPDATGSDGSPRRDGRANLGDALRLLPFVRPHAGALLMILGLSLLTAAGEGGQAYLVTPLVNRVLLRGGEEAGEEGDGDLLRELTALPGAAGAPAAAAAVVASELAVAGGPAPDALAAGLTPFAGRLAPDDGWAGDRLCALLGRTRAVVVAVGRGLRDDAGAGALEAGAARRLRAAIAVQQAAERLALPAPTLTPAPRAAHADVAALSLAARSLARDANFAGAREELWKILAAAIGLAVVLVVGRFGVAALTGEVVARAYQDMQLALVKRVLGLSLGQLQEERQGDLLSRLTADLARTVVGVLLPMVELTILQPTRLVLLFGLAIWTSPYLAACLVVLAAVVALPILRWGRTIRRSARKRQSALGDVLDVMQQMFAGIRVVKAFRREAWEAERFHRTTEEAYRAEVSSIRARTGSRTWMHLVNDVTFPLVFLGGGTLVMTHWKGLDAGRFMTFAGLILLMYRPLRDMAMAYNHLQDCLPSASRALAVLDMRPKLADDRALPDLPGLRESLRLEGVAFAYGSTPVLGGVTLEAKVGTTTAIVGPTGAGKSTLMDLLARLVEPTAGAVLADGRPLADFNRASWQRRLALVTQDAFVFNDTVRENIRYGRLDATEAEVEEAARRACIHDEIVALPSGYDYVVGERGSRLSGGQVQRLTIARAILRDPDVLLLDEGTSALDAEIERRVQAAIDEVGRGRTRFVVAHRLSTVRHADRIVVLGGGPPARVLEQGTHDELMARGGDYARLVTQFHDRGGGAPTPVPAPGPAAGAPPPPEPSGAGPPGA